jgi:hypothetical protein
VKCSACSAEINWWQTALSGIERNFMFNHAFAVIGARETLFRLVLKEGENLMYKFSDHGIPVGSKVLYVNYTPQGPGRISPVEFHGNVPTRKFFSDSVVLCPVPMGPPTEIKETEIAVLVSWVPSTADDESWDSLVGATESYSHERYSSMVVPANVAVESSLSRYLNRYLVRFASKDRVENFLDSAATYSHQLNVLLPMIAKLHEVAAMPAAVLSALNRLRKLRNDLAHAGVTPAPLDQKSAAELLCGALFGFHYVKYLSAKLK